MKNGIFYVSCIRISDPSCTCLVDRTEFPVNKGNMSKIQPCHAHLLNCIDCDCEAADAPIKIEWTSAKTL